MDGGGGLKSAAIASGVALGVVAYQKLKNSMSTLFARSKDRYIQRRTDALVEHIDILTLNEAKQRASVISNVEYDILLKFSYGCVVEGEVIMRFKCSSPNKSIFFDFSGSSIMVLCINGTFINADGSPITEGNKFKYGSARWCGHRVLISSELLSSQNEIFIRFTCDFDSVNAGIYRLVDSFSRDTTVCSAFGIFDAHRVIPLFDQPDIRATVNMSILAPPQYTCLSCTSRSNLLVDFGVYAPNAPINHRFASAFYDLSLMSEAVAGVERCWEFCKTVRPIAPSQLFFAVGAFTRVNDLIVIKPTMNNFSTQNSTYGTTAGVASHNANHVSSSSSQAFNNPMEFQQQNTNFNIHNNANILNPKNIMSSNKKAKKNEHVVDPNPLKRTHEIAAVDSPRVVGNDEVDPDFIIHNANETETMAPALSIVSNNNKIAPSNDDLKSALYNHSNSNQNTLFSSHMNNRLSKKNRRTNFNNNNSNFSPFSNQTSSFNQSFKQQNNNFINNMKDNNNNSVITSGQTFVISVSIYCRPVAAHDIEFKTWVLIVSNLLASLISYTGLPYNMKKVDLIFLPCLSMAEVSLAHVSSGAILLPESFMSAHFAQIISPSSLNQGISSNNTLAHSQNNNINANSSSHNATVAVGGGGSSFNVRNCSEDIEEPTVRIGGIEFNNRETSIVRCGIHLKRNFFYSHKSGNGNYSCNKSSNRKNNKSFDGFYTNDDNPEDNNNQNSAEMMFANDVDQLVNSIPIRRSSMKPTREISSCSSQFGSVILQTPQVEGELEEEIGRQKDEAGNSLELCSCSTYSSSSSGEDDKDQSFSSGSSSDYHGYSDNSSIILSDGDDYDEDVLLEADNEDVEATGFDFNSEFSLLEQAVAKVLHVGCHCARLLLLTLNSHSLNDSIGNTKHHHIPGGYESNAGWINTQEAAVNNNSSVSFNNNNNNNNANDGSYYQQFANANNKPPQNNKNKNSNDSILLKKKSDSLTPQQLLQQCIDTNPKSNNQKNQYIDGTNSINQIRQQTVNLSNTGNNILEVSSTSNNNENPQFNDTFRVDNFNNLNRPPTELQDASKFASSSSAPNLNTSSGNCMSIHEALHVSRRMMNRSSRSSSRNSFCYFNQHQRMLRFQRLIDENRGKFYNLFSDDQDYNNFFNKSNKCLYHNYNYHNASSSSESSSECSSQCPHSAPSFPLNHVFNTKHTSKRSNNNNNFDKQQQHYATAVQQNQKAHFKKTAMRNEEDPLIKSIDESQDSDHRKAILLAGDVSIDPSFNVSKITKNKKTNHRHVASLDHPYLTPVLDPSSFVPPATPPPLSIELSAFESKKRNEDEAKRNYREEKNEFDDVIDEENVILKRRRHRSTCKLHSSERLLQFASNSRKHKRGSSKLKSDSNNSASKHNNTNYTDGNVNSENNNNNLNVRIRERIARSIASANQIFYTTTSNNNNNDSKENSNNNINFISNRLGPYLDASAAHFVIRSFPPLPLPPRITSKIDIACLPCGLQAPSPSISSSVPTFYLDSLLSVYQLITLAFIHSWVIPPTASDIWATMSLATFLTLTFTPSHLSEASLILSARVLLHPAMTIDRKQTASPLAVEAGNSMGSETALDQTLQKGKGCFTLRQLERVVGIHQMKLGVRRFLTGGNGGAKDLFLAVFDQVVGIEGVSRQLQLRQQMKQDTVDLDLIHFGNGRPEGWVRTLISLMDFNNVSNGERLYVESNIATTANHNTNFLSVNVKSNSNNFTSALQSPISHNSNTSGGIVQDDEFLKQSFRRHWVRKWLAGIGATAIRISRVSHTNNNNNNNNNTFKSNVKSNINNNIPSDRSPAQPPSLLNVSENHPPPLTVPELLKSVSLSSSSLSSSSSTPTPFGMLIAQHAMPRHESERPRISNILLIYDVSSSLEGVPVGAEMISGYAVNHPESPRIATMSVLVAIGGSPNQKVMHLGRHGMNTSNKRLFNAADLNVSALLSDDPIAEHHHHSQQQQQDVDFGNFIVAIPSFDGRDYVRCLLTDEALDFLFKYSPEVVEVIRIPLEECDLPTGSSSYTMKKRSSKRSQAGLKESNNDDVPEEDEIDDQAILQRHQNKIKRFTEKVIIKKPKKVPGILSIPSAFTRCTLWHTFFDATRESPCYHPEERILSDSNTKSSPQNQEEEGLMKVSSSTFLAAALYCLPFEVDEGVVRTVTELIRGCAMHLCPDELFLTTSAAISDVARKVVVETAPSTIYLRALRGPSRETAANLKDGDSHLWPSPQSSRVRQIWFGLWVQIASDPSRVRPLIDCLDTLDSLRHSVGIRQEIKTTLSSVAYNFSINNNHNINNKMTMSKKNERRCRKWEGEAKIEVHLSQDPTFRTSLLNTNNNNNQNFSAQQQKKTTKDGKLGGVASSTSDDMVITEVVANPSCPVPKKDRDELILAVHDFLTAETRWVILERFCNIASAVELTPEMDTPVPFGKVDMNGNNSNKGERNEEFYDSHYGNSNILEDRILASLMREDPEALSRMNKLLVPCVSLSPTCRVSFLDLEKEATYASLGVTFRWPVYHRLLYISRESLIARLENEVHSQVSDRLEESVKPKGIRGSRHVRERELHAARFSLASRGLEKCRAAIPDPELKARIWEILTLSAAQGGGQNSVFVDAMSSFMRRNTLHSSEGFGKCPGAILSLGVGIDVVIPQPYASSYLLGVVDSFEMKRKAKRDYINGSPPQCSVVFDEGCSVLNPYFNYNLITTSTNSYQQQTINETTDGALLAGVVSPFPVPLTNNSNFIHNSTNEKNNYDNNNNKQMFSASSNSIMAPYLQLFFRRIPELIATVPPHVGLLVWTHLHPLQYACPAVLRRTKRIVDLASQRRQELHRSSVSSSSSTNNANRSNNPTNNNINSSNFLENGASSTSPFNIPPNQNSNPSPQHSLPIVMWSSIHAREDRMLRLLSRLALSSYEETLSCMYARERTKNDFIREVLLKVVQNAVSNDN